MSESRKRADQPEAATLPGKFAFPKVNREERLGLAQKLEEGARADWDYLMMITLAAVLASLGLLQDATAVVIGANRTVGRRA